MLEISVSAPTRLPFCPAGMLDCGLRVMGQGVEAELKGLVDENQAHGLSFDVEYPVPFLLSPAAEMILVAMTQACI